MKKTKKKVRWHKVSAPTTWRPNKAGEELSGTYAGRTLKSGSFGQYEVIAVAVPFKGTFMISGTMLIQLVDAAQISRGNLVRVVYCGIKAVGRDKLHEMKCFELYVGEDVGLDDEQGEEFLS